ncbi:MAG: hypothetical protein PHT69_00715 [Bacteroidales bacterium]|nr:hypothetical protein [Bacteroidales bacterium]
MKHHTNPSNFLYSKFLLFLGIVFLILSGCRAKKGSIKEDTDTLNSVFDMNNTNKCVAIYGVVQTVYRHLEIDSAQLEIEYQEFQERDDAVKN